MTCSYHLLTPADIPEFRALMCVFGDAFEDLESYQGAVPDDEYVGSLLAKAHFLVLVAKDGNAVVGGLTAYILDKFEQARREVYIYDLAVAETHRRRGIAKSLIYELQDVARDRGAYVVIVQADYGDDPAISLYESLGVREEVLHFDIAVPRGNT